MDRFVYFTFKRFVLLSGKLARHYASFAGLTPARLDLLLHLRAGPLVQRDLALDLCISASTLSKLVTALERLGLVRRTRVPNDRRMRAVVLTDAAEEAFAALAHAYFSLDPELSMQASAEHMLLEDWGGVLAENGFSAEPLGRSDALSLVRRMAWRIRATRYDDFGWTPCSPEDHALSERARIRDVPPPLEVAS